MQWKSTVHLPLQLHIRIGYFWCIIYGCSSHEKPYGRLNKWSMNSSVEFYSPGKLKLYLCFPGLQSNVSSIVSCCCVRGKKEEWHLKTTTQTNAPVGEKENPQVLGETRQTGIWKISQKIVLLRCDQINLTTGAEKVWKSLKQREALKEMQSCP